MPPRESMPRAHPELQELLVPLAPEERAALEASLRSEGCRDALVVWSGKGILLDGHNRLEICQQHDIPFQTVSVKLPDMGEAKAWIVRNQLGRRNLTAYQKAELVLRLEDNVSARAKQNQRRGGNRRGVGRRNSDNPLDTAEELASMAGMHRDTLLKAKKICAEADEKTKQKLRAGETSIHREYQRLKRAERKAEKESRKTVVETPADASRLCHLACAPIENAARLVKASSVDWVITDPPYGEEYLGLYVALGRFCAKVLRPGGSLLCMTGQSYLPQVYEALGRHLTYQWTLAYLTPGGQSAHLWQRSVNTFWKPLLWYVRGTYEGDWVGDVCRSDANDKRFHRWGQSENGMADVVGRFTHPGEMICDPFLGGGTTGVVAVRMGRKFIGIDVDPACIETARRRICGDA